MPVNRLQKPFVIPIFIPHAGCPHRCVFCDQTQTTGLCDPISNEAEMRATIDRFLGYRREPGRYTEISFYGGNFLGLQATRIQSLLEIGAGYVRQGAVNGLRFSTRPDTLSPETLSCIAAYPVTTLEIGVQSMNDEILALCRRGHTAEQVRTAMAELRQTPYRIGLQMMVGLPGDTPARSLRSAREIADLRPDFVRIYPTLVLKGSALARWYAEGRYTPWSLDESVRVVKTLLAFFLEQDIKVIRMGLQPTDDLNPQAGVLAGPFHPAFGEQVHAALWLDALKKAFTALEPAAAAIEVVVHPAMLSRVRGWKNKNIHELCRVFGRDEIKVRVDDQLPDLVARINGHRYHLLYGETGRGLSWG